MPIARVGRGVIEGFYGRAWSHAARVSMIRFLGEIGLDVYMRAPKNDPDGLTRKGHRLQRNATDEIAELVAVGREVGVDVACSVATEHVAELARLGVKTFVVAFDDTWATFARAAATMERGRRHGQAALDAWRAAREIDADARVLLVPAVYHRRPANMSNAALAYLRGIASVAQSIPVAWTGPNVFSRMITRSDLRALEEATGLALWIWNNAITNDWLPLLTGEPLGLRPREKLSFGPIENLSPELAQGDVGVLVNGAREPELTKISLATFAEWTKDPLHYDPRASHRAAIDRVAGDARDVVAAAYDWTQSHAFAAPARFEGRELDDRVRAYLGRRAERSIVEEALSAILDIRVRAGEAASRTAAAREVLPTVERAALLAEAGLLAVGRLETRDRDEQKNFSRKISALVNETSRIRWDVGLTSILDLLDGKPGSRAR